MPYTCVTQFLFIAYKTLITHKHNKHIIHYINLYISDYFPFRCVVFWQKRDLRLNHSNLSDDICDIFLITKKFIKIVPYPVP